MYMNVHECTLVLRLNEPMRICLLLRTVFILRDGVYAQAEQLLLVTSSARPEVREVGAGAVAPG